MKTKYLKISLPVAAVYTLLLGLSLFFSYSSWSKTRETAPTAAGSATANFEATKTDKPEFQFFVMSFCPYGNQIEDVIKPVAELLAGKADIRPQYIFDKINDLSSHCKTRSGDPTQCALYVQNKYFPNETDCKNTIAKNLATCLDQKNYIKAGNSYYSSLHGRVEANQNVREICAWNQAEDKKIWWNFIDNINQNCTSDNADTCWEAEAKKAGLDTTKITECFSRDAISLIEKEIAQTEKYKVSGSPTLIVNGVDFPPEKAYGQNNAGSLKIGKKVFTQDKYRTPNVIKEAVCASFKKAPKECSTTLPELTTQNAPAAGGC